jgi:hypothetical protein
MRISEGRIVLTTKERLSNQIKTEGLVEDEDATLGHEGYFFRCLYQDARRSNYELD